MAIVLHIPTVSMAHYNKLVSDWQQAEQNKLTGKLAFLKLIK